MKKHLLKYLLTSILLLGCLQSPKPPSPSSSVKASDKEPELAINLPALLPAKEVAMPDTASKKGIDKEIANEDIMAKIYKDIEAREYHISYDEVTERYQSPNRAHNIRSYYAQGEWKLQNRIDSVGYNWELLLQTKGIYADEQLLTNTSSTASIVRENAQIDFKLPTYTEQYVNSAAGTRQNFIIHQAPEGTKELRVALAYEGMKVQQQSQTSLFFSKGEQRLKYAGLKAWDANDKAIEAHIELDAAEQN